MKRVPKRTVLATLDAQCVPSARVVGLLFRTMYSLSLWHEVTSRRPGSGHICLSVSITIYKARLARQAQTPRRHSLSFLILYSRHLRLCHLRPPFLADNHGAYHDLAQFDKVDNHMCHCLIAFMGFAVYWHEADHIDGKMSTIQSQHSPSIGQAAYLIYLY